MILVQDIVDLLESRLDAEGSDYYNFDDNYKFAINSAQKWLVSLINHVKSTHKVSDEIFRDLNVCKVFKTSVPFSRIALPADMWSLDSLNPLPLTHPPLPSNIVASELEDADSEEVSDYEHVSSAYFCKRLTKEQWEKNRKNPFKPGNLLNNCYTENIQDGSDLNIEFAYLASYRYRNTEEVIEEEGEEDIVFIENDTLTEVEIRPNIKGRHCTVFYVKLPTVVDSIADEIEFPQQAMNLIVDKALEFIAIEQGEDMGIWQITQKDINQFVSLLQ